MLGDRTYSVRFGHLGPTPAEWEVVKNIVLFLKPFKDVTMEVTKQTKPTIQHVVLFFNDLFDFVEQATSSNERTGIIKTAAESALVVLRKYYGKTDDCLLLFIAVCESQLWYCT